MIAFIKDYDLSSIRKKLVLLYILNVTDIILPCFSYKLASSQR